MFFQVQPAGLHEGQRLGNPVRQFQITLARLRIDVEQPLVHAAEARVAAMCQRADEVQRRGRMPVGLDQPLRIGDARGRRELGAVDDVAAVARQLLAALLLDRRRPRLGELAGDAADLHHRHRGGIGQHHRHLQEHAKEVADVVGADVVGARIGEAFGAIPALQQETLALGDAAQRLLQVARLARKNQRRIARELTLDALQHLVVRVLGDLDNRLSSPAIARPTFGHDATLRCLNFPCGTGTYNGPSTELPAAAPPSEARARRGLPLEFALAARLGSPARTRGPHAPPSQTRPSL